MIRVICEEVHFSDDGVNRVSFATVDVEDAALETYLKGVQPPFQRRIIGSHFLNESAPGPNPVPDDAVLIYDVPAGVPVDENVFGFTVLHGGESYYSPNMTPEGGAVGGRMAFHWTRQFASWSKVEAAKGIYTWGTVANKANYFAERSLNSTVRSLGPVARTRCRSAASSWPRVRPRSL